MRDSVLVSLVVGFLVGLHFLLKVGLGLETWVPDLLTLGLLIGVRHTHVGMGAGLGFAFGLLEDAFSLLSFGASTVALTVVGSLGAQTRDLFLGDSILFAVSYLAAGTWLRYAIHWVVAGEGVRGPVVQALAVDAPLQAAYVAVVGVVVLVVTGVWWESA